MNFLNFFGGYYLLRLCILFIEIDNSIALIPKVCVNNITGTGGSGICCPLSKSTKLVCGGNGRGTCLPVFRNGEKLDNADLLVDDRMQWPQRFFKDLCLCEGNFFGLSCDECWFGWTGENCDQRQEMIRRNILTYTSEERRRFLHILTEMPNTPTENLIIFEHGTKNLDPIDNPKFIPANLQYLITYIHEFTSRNTLFSNQEMCSRSGYLDNNHNVAGFLTWHRYLMLTWERELRKIAKKLYGWHDFTVPYWDWIDASECEVCTNELVGSPGPWENGIRRLHHGSPFFNFTEYCTYPEGPQRHCIGCHSCWPKKTPLNRHFKALEFPTTEDLEFALSRENFFLYDPHEGMQKCRSFHQALEGFCGRPDDRSNYMYMHNKVHNMVHGSHCCSATSTNDPLFILHHVQIDRIFELWFQRMHPRITEYPENHVAPGSCRECPLIGWIPIVRHVQLFTDAKSLGIRYENLDFGKRGFRGKEYIENGPRIRERDYTEHLEL